MSEKKMKERSPNFHALLEALKELKKNYERMSEEEIEEYKIDLHILVVFARKEKDFDANRIKI